MPVRNLALAGAMIACLATTSVAEELRPPEELPPAGYKGEQYVDSAGCVFLRAGVGERVTWVARISRDRRQMCGLAPTFAPRVAVASVAVAPEPAPLRAAARSRAMDMAPTVAAKPVVAEARGATVVCPAQAPVARRFAVKGGGTKVLCIPESADLENFVLPKGYRHAWTDDRLNPLRGLGTVEGEAMQARVWTRKVPARLVTEASARPDPVEAPSQARAVPNTSSGTTLSTSTGPAKAGGHYLVQVGSFGVPANAERTRERLAALGLPVSGGKGVIRGQTVQVVYAGPFVGSEAAQAALRAVRGAGFGDAFLR